MGNYNGPEKLRYNNVRKEQAAVSYTISTLMAQEYLQKRLDMLISQMRKSDERYMEMPNIPVKVSGSQASNNFVPLCIALTPDALESQNINNDESIPSIYKNKDDEGEVALVPEIEMFLKTYAYSKQDIRLFRNQAWIRDMNISNKIGQSLEFYSCPRYREADKSSDAQDVVMTFIDPCRVFHDMLIDETDVKRQFTVKITRVKRIRAGQYEYTMIKEYGGKNKKNKKNDEFFFREIDSLLRR